MLDLKQTELRICQGWWIKVRFVVFIIFLGGKRDLELSFQQVVPLMDLLSKHIMSLRAVWIGLLSPETVKQKAQFFCGVYMHLALGLCHLFWHICWPKGYELTLEVVSIGINTSYVSFIILCHFKSSKCFKLKKTSPVAQPTAWSETVLHQIILRKWWHVYVRNARANNSMNSCMAKIPSLYWYINGYTPKN